MNQEQADERMVSVPLETALLIRKVFIPHNPNKMRNCAPEVRQAARDYIAAVELTEHRLGGFAGIRTISISDAINPPRKQANKKAPDLPNSMSNLHPIMQAALAPFFVPANKREEKRVELQRTISELNDSSPECLLAVMELDLMRVEDTNAKLREACESLRGENARLNAECEKLIRDNAAMKRRLSDWE